MAGWSDLDSPVFDTGVKLTGSQMQTFRDYAKANEVIQSLGSISSNTAIDVTSGRIAEMTIAGNLTLSFTSVPSVQCTKLVLKIINGGAYTITWPAGVTWNSGISPSLSTSGVDIITLITIDAGTTWYAFREWAAAGSNGLASGTVQSSTSGTTIDFPSLPSGVKRVTVMFKGVSTDSTSNYLIQLGDSGGFETSGYSGTYLHDATRTSYSGSGFEIYCSAAAAIIEGTFTLSLIDASTNSWVGNGDLAMSNANTTLLSAGSKDLSGTLTQVRITTVSTDDFDAGKINILYEV